MGFIKLMAYKKPTGTVDFFPEEMEIRTKVFDSLRNTANKFGFKEVEAPAIESLEMLEAKAGEEIKKQLFTLEQKGNEKLSMRAELTPSIARMFVDKQKELAKPVKWFGLSRMWRYERPQAGRLREFYQLSVEMFGSDKSEADAEIINLAIECLRDLGLNSEDFFVRLNNRKLLQGIITMFTDKVEDVISLVDKKDKLEDKDFDKGLDDFNVKDKDKFKEMLAMDLNELEKVQLNEMAKAGLEELQKIMQFVNKKFVQIDLTIARGLAYYTGSVFELWDKKGQFRALAGGGRYNNMVELFGGEKTPATGFAIGYATLSLLLEERGLTPKLDSGVDYYIVIIGEGQLKEKALAIVNKLRKKNSVDYDIMGRSIKKQMDYANKINAKNVIFIGEKEIWTKKLTVKDMKTGKEKEISIDSI